MNLTREVDAENGLRVEPMDGLRGSRLAGGGD